jgi:hypothetical protein
MLLKVLVILAFIVGAYILGWKVGDRVSEAISLLAKDLWTKFLALFKKK